MSMGLIPMTCVFLCRLYTYIGKRDLQLFTKEKKRPVANELRGSNKIG